MNKQEANLCALISEAAYTGQCRAADFQLTARFENKGTDTQGIFGIANDDTFVIAFRGSEETGLTDWITDLKFVKQVFPYEESGNKKVKVHYGFIWAYKSVRESVLKAARETDHQRIICTGHSLGAALATLCALDLQYNLPEKEIVCYTYGSPKVGNADFVASYNRRVPNTFRFVNRSDTVPNLPFGGYDHVGRLFQLGQAGPAAGMVDKVMKVMEDHYPHNYIKAIKEWLL